MSTQNEHDHRWQVFLQHAFEMSKFFFYPLECLPSTDEEPTFNPRLEAEEVGVYRCIDIYVKANVTNPIGIRNLPSSFPFRDICPLHYPLIHQSILLCRHSMMASNTMSNMTSASYHCQSRLYHEQTLKSRLLKTLLQQWHETHIL